MKVNIEKLIPIINEKWLKKECSLCGSNDWNIGDDIMVLMSVNDNKSINIGGKTMPVIAIICNNCGNIVFVNPLVIDCVDEM